MTRLLISVRTPEEADVAVKHGADLIDIKETTRGPMGMADPQTMRDIIERVAGRKPVSAALGELRDNADLPELPAGLDFVKIGLARVGKNWQQQLDERFARVPTAGAVPVLYADLVLTDKCPDPVQVLMWCQERKAAGILLDTYGKKKDQCLLDIFPEDLLVLLVEIAHRTDLFIAMAGGLGGESARSAALLGADIVGMRTAVCRNHHRNAALDPLVIRGQQLNLALAGATLRHLDQLPAGSPSR